MTIIQILQGNPQRFNKNINLIFNKNNENIIFLKKHMLGKGCGSVSEHLSSLCVAQGLASSAAKKLNQNKIESEN